MNILYHQKITIVIAFVISLIGIVPLQAMERAPLVPVTQKKDANFSNPAAPISKRGTKRASNDEHKENTAVPAPTPAGVVTPNGKALRRKIADDVKRCIAAPHESSDMGKTEDELAPEVLTFSPKSFTKTLYARAMNAVKMKCQRLGATEAQMKARLEDARLSVDAEAYLRKTMARKPSKDETEDFKRLSVFFDAAEFELRYDPTIANAVSEGSAVVANKSEMDKLTFVQRMAVYAHEITHGKNEDWTYRKAYQAEFEALGKHAEYKASIEPVLFRTQEVFADLVPGAKAPSLARGITEFRQAILRANGRGAPSTHPANDAWAELDATMVALHAKHTEEKKRRERLSQSSKRLRGLLGIQQQTAADSAKK